MPAAATVFDGSRWGWGVRSRLEAILAEQRVARDYVLAHPDDRGALLWLADSVWDEIILMRTESMTFSRTTDAALIRSVMTDTRIWSAISDDGSPPREEFQPVICDAIWYVAVHDGAELLGLFMFTPLNTILWEVHTCLLPISWGDRAVAAARQLSPWIWANTQCRRAITSVPAYNRLALRLAKEAGMVEYGVNPQSFLKGGKLHDQHMLGISPPG
jgi:RimJ/RimL family protein N-acetyltransferase